VNIPRKYGGITLLFHTKNIRAALISTSNNCFALGKMDVEMPSKDFLPRK
jgi:hypothetical protein